MMHEATISGSIAKSKLIWQSLRAIEKQIPLTLIGRGANNDGAQTDYWTQADWTWTGNNWIEENTTGPAVQSSQIFYDKRLHMVFELTTFLPRTSVNIENKLWKWTGQTWVAVENW